MSSSNKIQNSKNEFSSLKNDDQSDNISQSLSDDCVSEDNECEQNKYNSDEDIKNSNSSSLENSLDMSLDSDMDKSAVSLVNSEDDDLSFTGNDFLSNYDFVDNHLIKKLKDLDSAPNSIGKILLETESIFNTIQDDDVVKIKFYLYYYYKFIYKVFILHKTYPNILNEIINSFKSIELLCCDIISKALKNIKKYDKNNIKIIFELSYLLLELYLNIISSQNIYFIEDSIILSIEFFLSFLEDFDKENQELNDSNKQTQKLSNHVSQNSNPDSNINKVLLNSENLSLSNNYIENYFKKYISTIHTIILNKKEFHVNLSFELYKKLFTLSFTLFKFSKFSFIYVKLVDILIIILENAINEKCFIDKFLFNYIDIFDHFLKSKNIYDENKYINLKINILIKNLKNYFGEYKCLNNSNESISLFTYLFLKSFTVFYSQNFNEIIQSFTMTVLTWSNNNILLILYVLFYELNTIKYNLEFSISLPIFTYYFSCINNFLNSNEFDINKKKFFCNIIDFFYTRLLNDFENIKKCFFCIDKSTSYKHINEEKKEEIKEKKSSKSCSCFSCTYTNEHSNIFICQQCKCLTNLKLQLIDFEKDDNISVCGFCNLKAYFESASEIFDKDDYDFMGPNKPTQAENIKNTKKVKSNKKKNKKDNSQNDKENESNVNKTLNLYDKLMDYQENLYKNSFLFIKIALLNYIKISTMITNKTLNNQIDKSFEIFIKYFINDEKMAIPKYKIFYKNLINFYNLQKGRVFNIHQEINISDDTIKFFYFYCFYINFLVGGHWKIINILLSKYIHWKIKKKLLRIIIKYINFEGKMNLFENYNILILSNLLSENSIYIREYTLEILLTLYKNEKIPRNQFIDLLYENVNETSFYIRKKIISILIDIILVEKEREFYDIILYIFLNKLMDNSESIKIKNMINDFFIFVFNPTVDGKDKIIIKKYTNEINNSTISNNYDISQNDDLFGKTLSVFINLLKETENLNSSTNFMIENFKKMFEVIGPKINNYEIIVVYLFRNYILNSKCDESYIIQSLNLLKIITLYHVKSILIYIDCIIDLLIYKIKNEGNSISDNYSNKISQLASEILNNIFIFLHNDINISSDNGSIKEYLISKIVDRLLYLTLNRPYSVMISCMNTYFTMEKYGEIEMDKMEILIIKTINLLNKLYIDKSFGEIPEFIITKSLYLMSFSIYALDEYKLYSIIEKSEIKTSTKEYHSYLFNLLSFYCLKKEKTLVNYISFECFGYFWTKFPLYLKKSSEVINFIIEGTENEQEKIIILRTFYTFFNKISDLMTISQQKMSQNNKEKLKKSSSSIKGKSKKESIVEVNNSNNSNNYNMNFDFGIIHLFFDNFINKFSIFLLKEKSDEIRLRTIYLLKLLINFGNLNVHKVLPHIFIGLFDILSEIRFNSTILIEKIIFISQSKFYQKLNESLYNSFVYQKENYVEESLINIYVKTRDNDKNIKNSKENVFNLLFYKINKNSNNDNIIVKLYENIINVFNNISSLQNNFSSSNKKKEVKNYISQIEYYEYLSKLIGDFSFTNRKTIFIVFNKIYSNYPLEMNIYNAKVQEYIDDEDNYKINYSLLYYFILVGIKTFLIKYFLIKYEIVTDSEMDEALIKGWNAFANSYLSRLDKKKNKKKAEDSTKENVDSTKSLKKIEYFQSVELKRTKFYEFFTLFLELKKLLFDIQIKKNSKKLTIVDKKITIEILNKIKNFSTLKLKQYKDLIKKKDRYANVLVFLKSNYFIINSFNSEVSDEDKIKNEDNQDVRRTIIKPKNVKNRINIDSENDDNEKQIEDRDEKIKNKVSQTELKKERIKYKKRKTNA